MEEDMGLSFDATITAKEAKKKLHIPIMMKNSDTEMENKNEDGMENDK
jgi:hypothetical protein